ncbi:GNAT family N-acetyltransferase [Micromonospora ureilytica]|uniref:GNAT family N-acetyltransferase n=1 Tax=Micromonospora ureilytica TaxID=709868 RepID=A0A3N9XC82_9ACTN|nr:GNAT family N-acetyltransferase [Micromonospora ureilytica]MBG6065413.1 ribosomal protein S18 acetylase RimI-like enzyme [Micromonospora ureilytica]RQX10735.1 GNAT family N-acetyltransferase [Micromonospora ureilytica]WSR54953.1 GNAT family N-acetyltransferase [Micromonospora ureilytica]
MDVRIQQSVVANLSNRPAPVEVGPFVIGMDPTTTSPHINYATPRPGAAITAADVTALVAAFRAAGRKPRLEYVSSCASGLEAQLVADGFTVEARHTYLICVPSALTAPPTLDGLNLREPGTDVQRAALISAQNEAFGGDPVASTADVARLRRQQGAGGVAVMAVTDDGTCAGGGGAAPPTGAVSEVAGIAVRTPFRRRGLAGAITAELTRRLFTTGAEIAWLEASGEDSWRVYERVGYRPAGERLYIGTN